MKKSILIIPLLLVGWCVLAENFPAFPMTIYGDVKIWTTNLVWWTLSVYDSSNTELASYTITESWKYGSTNVWVAAFVVNSFDWWLTFKATYNWKNYVVDSIDDSNRWELCPSKDSITFVSADCRYDIVLKEEVSSTPSNPWGWWGGWWWGWWWGGSSNYSCKNLPANATANNNTTPKADTNYTYSTSTSKVCTFQCNTWYSWNATSSKCEKTEASTWDTTNEPTVVENKPTITTDNSWYIEWDQQYVMSNWYTREFNNAYTFAYKNWITTMDSINKANMNGPLNRIAMAKMLSNYAMNVLGKKPANVVVPNFPDVSAELNEQYWWAVTLAYQLWIMWLNIDKFRPNDPVTRAEFGTALSRMLYWLSDGNPYYSTHLAKLKRENIISNDTPNLKELRGYVMLMLMRSAM